MLVFLPSRRLNVLMENIGLEKRIGKRQYYLSFRWEIEKYAGI